MLATETGTNGAAFTSGPAGAGLHAIRASVGLSLASGGFGRPLGRLVVIVVVGLSGPGAAAQQAAPSRLPANAVSVSAGLFRPADNTFRAVYGSRQVPVSVQASHRLWRSVSVFGGVRYAGVGGQTFAMGPSAAGEQFSVRLSTLTWRAGALVGLQRAGWVFEAGGGVTRGRYTERWLDATVAAAEVRTTRFGALLQAGASRAISQRLAVVGRVEYSLVRHAPAQQGGSIVPRNLGGVDSTIGLLLRF